MIKDHGWSDALQQTFAPYAARGLIPGRVIVQQRGLFHLATERGELAAEPTGRLSHAGGDYPVAGDWVAAAEHPGGASIHAVLPRRTPAAGPAGASCRRSWPSRPASPTPWPARPTAAAGSRSARRTAPPAAGATSRR